MINDFNSYRFRSSFYWESLVTGGANLLGSIFGYAGQKSANKTNIQAVRETNAANRKLAEYQNEMNLAQWNRENEYNHPIQQMARLQSAGLNPHLVYGSGAQTVSAKSPEMVASRDQAPHVDPVAFDAGSVGRGFAEGVSLHNAIKDSIAKRESLGHQNSYVDALAAKALTEAALSSKDLAIRDELNKYSLEAAKSSWRNLEKDLEVKSQNIAESQQRIAESKQRVNLIVAQTDLTEVQARKAEKEIYEVVSRIALNNAGAALKRSQTNLTDQQYKLDKATYGSRVSQAVNTANKVFIDCQNAAKQGKLTEKMIDKYTAEITQSWTRLGLDITRAASAETRAWLYGWIPGANPSSNYGVTYTSH